MNRNLLVQYLNTRRVSMSKQEDAVQLHSALCEAAPDFYLHLLADPVAEISHKRTVLANLVCMPAARHIDRQRILELLHTLPAAEVLSIIEELYLDRVNRRRARALGLAFLLGHAHFPELAATRRQRLVRLLKHFLGERTWSSVGRFLANPTPEGEKFLSRVLLHYAERVDVQRVAAAREALCFLASVPFTPSNSYLARSLAARQNLEQGETLPRETLFGLRGTFHKDIPASKVRYLSAVASESARKDGPLSTLYKQMLFDGPTEKQSQELSDRLAQAVESLPVIEGHLAIVLDLSGSSASSGERAQHPSALGLALTRIIQQRVRETSLHQVGGSTLLAENAIPFPQGTTDVAKAILDAARQNPQAILVITDGYENVRQGDAAEVVRGMQQLGLHIPVYQIVPVFAAAEDLSQRRLGGKIQLLPVEHEEGVRELLGRVVLTSFGETLSLAETALMQHLLFAR